jgi:hypothetical protein
VDRNGAFHGLVTIETIARKMQEGEHGLQLPADDFIDDAPGPNPDELAVAEAEAAAATTRSA